MLWPSLSQVAIVCYFFLLFETLALGPFPLLTPKATSPHIPSTVSYLLLSYKRVSTTATYCCTGQTAVTRQVLPSINLAHRALSLTDIGIGLYQMLK